MARCTVCGWTEQHDSCAGGIDALMEHRHLVHRNLPAEKQLGDVKRIEDASNLESPTAGNGDSRT